ncbi:hypothetical protein D7243_22655 [Stutzerimonas stutzeri]|nr:hypothetical protein [Stutzerimonas stutzeri]
MEAFGFSAEDFEVEIEIWPDNWDAFEVFAAMQTQWRTGMSGATGLDYNALEPVMRLRGIKKRDRGELFDCIRVMEIAALEVMRAK